MHTFNQQGKGKNVSRLFYTIHSINALQCPAKGSPTVLKSHTLMKFDLKSVKSLKF